RKFGFAFRSRTAASLKIRLTASSTSVSFGAAATPTLTGVDSATGLAIGGASTTAGLLLEHADTNTSMIDTKISVLIISSHPSKEAEARRTAMFRRASG